MAKVTNFISSLSAENRNYAFLEFLKVPACIIDKTGTFVFMNSSFKNFLGDASDEIKLDETHPYFSEYRSNITHAFQNAKKGIEGKSFAVVRSNKSGTQSIEIYYYPLSENNGAVHIFALLRPVDERILSYDNSTKSLITSTKTCYESTMFEYSPLGIFRVSKECVIIKSSLSFETMTGYNEQLLPSCAAFFVYDHDRFKKIVTDIFDGIIPFHRMGEVKIMTSKKTQAIVNLIIYPVINEGTIEAVEVLMENITRVKELEKKISSMNKIEMMSDITYGFIHSLNNTMNVILSQSQLLQQLIEKESLKERIDIIENSALAIIDQLNRYQNFISDGEETNTEEQSSLIDLIEDTLEFSKMQFKIDGRDLTKEITIEKTYYIKPEVNLSSKAFKELMVAALLKVASFINKRGIISVELKTQKDIAITISTLKTIVEPDTLLQNETQNVMSSMNLRHLAEAANLKIFEEESQKDFSLKIIVPARFISGSQKDDTGPPEYKIRNHDILIIEDEPDLQRILYELFDTMGNRVAVTDNGEEALALFKAGSFDLVLTDYDIIGSTGIELAARIKEIDEDVVTVLLSGWILNDLSAYKNFIDLFVSKPFRLEELIKKTAQTFQKSNKAKAHQNGKTIAQS